MKQLKLTFLLTMLISMVGTKAFAYTCKIDGICYNLIDNNHTAIVTYSGYPYNNDYTGHYGGSGLKGKDIHIPSTISYNDEEYTVTAIGDNAFFDCESSILMSSVTIPSSVTSIGSRAFWKCTALTSFTIPNSVTSIGESAFYCSGLTSVTIGNSVTSIGEYAFYGCSGLTSVTIPNSVTRIGNGAFSYCSGLTSLVISNSVTLINQGTFSSCTKLTTVTIPNNVTDIKTYAFKNCSGLTTLIIGSNVSEIQMHAFYDCRNIINVYCHAEKVPNLEYEALENANIRSATLHVPESLVEVYKNLDEWKNFASIVALTDSDPGMQKCATPIISIIDGKLKFSCETEDVTFKTYCTYDSSSSILNGDELVVGGTTICHVNVYATKVGNKDSDNATVDIEINVGKLGDVDADGVVSISDAVSIVNLILKNSSE